MANAEELGAVVIRLLANDAERVAMGEAAQAVLERERGAVQRTLRIVEQVLANVPVKPPAD